MLQISRLRGPLLVLAGALCFSCSGFLQAIAPLGATPYVIAGCRMLIGAATLFLYLYVSGRKVHWGNWPWNNILVCAVALWFFQMSFFNSVLLVGVAIGTVVSIGVTPIFSGIITWVMEKKSPVLAWYPATVLAIIGLFLINTIESADFAWYDLLLPIFAGACYSVEICVSKPLTDNHSAEESMMLIMFLVGLGLVPFFFFYPVEWVATVDGIAVALGLGVVTAACAFSLLVAGIKTTPAPIASTLALGEPMGAALLGILILGEPCDIKSLLGIASIFASIVVLVIAEVKEKSQG